jgi:hypothetical protein
VDECASVHMAAANMQVPSLAECCLLGAAWLLSDTKLFRRAGINQNWSNRTGVCFAVFADQLNMRDMPVRRNAELTNLNDQSSTCNHAVVGFRLSPWSPWSDKRKAWPRQSSACRRPWIWMTAWTTHPWHILLSCRIWSNRSLMHQLTANLVGHSSFSVTRVFLPLSAVRTTLCWLRACRSVPCSHVSGRLC